MYKEERRRLIQGIVSNHGQADVGSLARQFNVSEMTIRRDLQALSSAGEIQRTHGGALAPRYPGQSFESPMLSRINHLAEEKRQIAAAVAEMIGPGEKIYLSSGSTTYWLARALLGRSDLTVVVNSLIISNVLAQSVDMVVIVVGGFLRRSELSLVGHYAETVFQDLRVDKVIMGIRGIHPEYGLTSDNPQELMTDRAILKMSDQVIIAADHTKFGRVAASRTAPVSAAHTIVTSRKAPTDIVECIESQGVRVIKV